MIALKTQLRDTKGPVDFGPFCISILSIRPVCFWSMSNLTHHRKLLFGTDCFENRGTDLLSSLVCNLQARLLPL